MSAGRGAILTGMTAGALWALAVVFGPALIDLPFLPPPIALPGAFLAPGLVLAAVIGRLALRRAFAGAIADADADAGATAPGAPAGIDRRVLRDTVEQLVLALAIWPFVALTQGGAAAIALGLSFALMRLLFWIGCHLSPLLRGLGFVGTFGPTVLAGLWALIRWAL